MKKLILLVAALLIFTGKAEAFDLGGLSFTFGPSPSTFADVQIVGRSAGRSFVGGGVCSKYAYRLNAADTFNVDLLAICAVATGSFDGDSGKFIGGAGISPVSFFDGKLKMFLGVDVGDWKVMQGQATTLSAVVKF